MSFYESLLSKLSFWWNITNERIYTVSTVTTVVFSRIYLSKFREVRPSYKDFVLLSFHLTSPKIYLSSGIGHKK